jgi:CRP-like cAMP-binding protein
MIGIMSQLVDAFAGLTDREELLAEGQHLFRNGDPIRSMFFVTEGEVRLLRQLPHGPLLTIQVARAGSLLAEASLFAAEYHCDAVATRPSRVLAAPRRKVERSATADPDIARAWLHHLSREIQLARGRVEIISLKTVAERLAAWLMLHDCDLPARGEWRALATELAVTPEALYRELARRRQA